MNHAGGRTGSCSTLWSECDRSPVSCLAALKPHILLQTFPMIFHISHVKRMVMLLAEKESKKIILKRKFKGNVPMQEGIC